MVTLRCSFRSATARALTGGALAAVLLLAGPLPRCWAQAAPAPDAYTWDSIGAEFAAPAAVNTQKGAKDQVIYGRSSFAANRPLIDSWYRSYLFPSMATEDQLGEISEKREMLAKDLEMTSDAALHQYLTDLAYDEATRRASGPYHPFVRYNAMLIVGLNLNQLESRLVGGVRYPAIRLPKALDFLVDELKKPDQSDAVRLAAMLGIERHVDLVRQRPQDQPIPDGRRAEIAAYMQTLLAEKSLPAGRNPAAHTWLRRKAADVLGGLGAVGDNRSVFESLVRIVGDAEEPLSLRCTAAETLGNLVYTDVTGIDAVATARQLAALAAFACRTEDTRAKEEQKKLEEDPGFRRSGGMMGGPGGMMGPGMSPGMGPGMMGPGMGPGMMGPGTPPGSSAAGGSSSGGYPGSSGGYPGGVGGYPGSSGGYPGGSGGGGGYPGMGPFAGRGEQSSETDELMERARRRLKLPLACVLTGMRGPQERSPSAALGAIGQLAADDQQKAEITKIVNALDAVIKATDQTKEGLEGMLQKVRDRTRDLEKLLPNLAQAAAQPTADEALPGAGAAGPPSLPGAAAGAAPAAAAPPAAAPAAGDAGASKKQ
ncbi:MAG: hypothetical protein ACYC0X_24670 [Pirellulaceae bacterium]